MSHHLKFYLDPEAKQAGACFEPPRDGDAGFDLRSAAALSLAAGEQVLVPTGLKIAVPAGWVGIIKDRSSMASRRIYTHAGVIDSGYRGEVKILLSNHSRESYEIESGAKVAQLLIVPYLCGCQESSSLDQLGDTARGEGGFGSTGL